MELLRHKAFLFTLRSLYFTNRIMLLLPITQRRGHGVPTQYRTHKVTTACSTLLCLLLTCASPIFLQHYKDVYDQFILAYDSVYKMIALATLCCDVGISLLIFVLHIWKRRQLSEFMTMCRYLLKDLLREAPLKGDVISWSFLLVLWIKIGLAIYDVVLNLLYISLLADKINTLHLFSSVGTLFIQTMRTVFSVNIFTIILLLYFFYQRMALSIEGGTVPRRMQKILKNLVLSCEVVIKFLKTFQFAIFLLVFGLFYNILANLYALLYSYVMRGRLWIAYVGYILCLAVEMYSFFLVAHICHYKQRRCKDLLLEKLSLRQLNVYWLPYIEFRILGMFSLSNRLWTFVVSYATNFIVIILQFSFDKYAKKNIK